MPSLSPAAGFFPASAYVLALALTQISQSLVEAGLFCTIIFFLTGLATGASAFFTFFLLGFSLSNALAALFRGTAFVCSRSACGPGCSSRRPLLARPPRLLPRRLVLGCVCQRAQLLPGLRAGAPPAALCRALTAAMCMLPKLAP